jgi:hypothetical protein
MKWQADGIVVGIDNIVDELLWRQHTISEGRLCGMCINCVRT